MGDLTQALAQHAAHFDAARLPPAVVEHLGRDLADTLGAAIGGSNAPGVAETRAFLAATAAPGKARLFAAAGTLPALFAAQANATAGHALDYDDTLDDGGGMHAGTSVHAAALAVADELGGVSGREYASAVAVGLDVAVRLALAPTEDFGWHRTSAFGIFGVTVAVGRLLRLDADQFAHALGIAYSQASGNRQCIADGALSKRLQAGFAARDGITAVHLARAGLTGASRAFEGKDGFFNLYQRGAYRRDTVLDGLGEELLSTRISLKPYPCGRNLHALIDATLNAREQRGSDDIAAIIVTLPSAEAARAAAGYPTHVVEAQFNARFVVALGLATGTSPLAAFDDPAAVEADLRPLLDKIAVIARDDGGAGAKVELRYADGKAFSAEVLVPRGNPRRPLAAETIKAKAQDCNAFAGSPLPSARLDAVVTAALDLDRLASTNILTDLLGL